MRIALLVVVFCAWGPIASAESWRIDADANLTLNQSSYSDNWVGGETGSITWAVNSNTVAEKSMARGMHFKNTLKLAFGQTYTQDDESRRWSPPAKSTDLIDLELIMRFAAGSLVEPTAAVRGISQFYDKRIPGRPLYLNPLTFTETVGISRLLVKNKTTEIGARIGAGFRQGVDRNFFDPAAPERTTKITKDGGFELVADVKYPLAGNKVQWVSKLTVFQAVYSSRAQELRGTPEEDYWRHPDVNWENIFTASISKYVMVNVYTQLLYDKELARAARLKETLALGLTFKIL